MYSMKLINKRSLHLLLVFFIAFGMLGGFAVNPAIAKAEGDPGFTFTVTQNVYDVKQGQYVSFRVDYEATRVGAIKEGNQLKFTLPDMFNNVTPKVPTEHFSGCVTEGTDVVCTFGSGVETGLKGYMILEATIKWGTEPGKKEIVIEINDVVTTIPVNVLPPGTPGDGENKRILIDKWADNLGHDTDGRGVVIDFDKPIEYLVRVNYAKQELKNVVVIDEIPDGLELVHDSVKFYEDSPYKENNRREFDYSVNGKELEANFGDITSTFYIKYELKVTGQ